MFPSVFKHYIYCVDTAGRVRDDVIRLSLPDKDVFVLDATANPPRQVPGTRAPPRERHHRAHARRRRGRRPVTYTCVPLGSGERIGVDRDGDGAWDGDERDAETDPADADSRP